MFRCVCVFEGGGKTLYNITPHHQDVLLITNFKMNVNR